MTSRKQVMEKRDLSRLLDYYRIRLENVERERKEFLEKLESIKISQEDSHKNQWELRKRTEEVIELQNALSVANISVNHERKHVINLCHELEIAKIKTTEDRKRLLQMLQIAEPIEQTVKLFVDRRPEKLEKYTNVDINLESFTKSLSQNKTLTENLGINQNSSIKPIKNFKSSGSVKRIGSKTENSNNQNRGLRIPPSDEKQQIIRTIILPNDEKNSLGSQVESLQSTIKDLKNYYESHIIKLEEDRRLREEEFRLQNLNYKESVDNLLRKNQKLESLNVDLMKDYMQIKFESQENEKKIFEEIEVLKIQNEALADTVKQLTEKNQIEKESHKIEFDRKTNEISNVYRSQVKNNEENINIIKEQYKQIQKIYNKKVNDLVDKLKNLTEKHKNLEIKRNNELEGFLNEIALIRKRMRTYENYIHKIKSMTSGNSVDIKKLKEVNSEINSTSGKFFEGVKTFKSDLESLQQKISDNLYGNTEFDAAQNNEGQDESINQKSMDYYNNNQKSYQKSIDEKSNNNHYDENYQEEYDNQNQIEAEEI